MAQTRLTAVPAKDSSKSWPPVRGAARSTPRPVATGDPSVIDHGYFVPGAETTLTRGANAQAAVLAFSHGIDGSGEPLDLSAEVQGSDGLPRLSSVPVIYRSDREPVDSPGPRQR